MNVAVDLDGTADSFPRVFQSLCSALTAAGHHVIILTGSSTDTVTPEDVEAKREYLTSLGFGPESYSSIVVVPKPHPKNKAAEVATLDIDLLIDNKQGTVKKTALECPSLLLWNSKEK